MSREHHRLLCISIAQLICQSQKKNPSFFKTAVLRNPNDANEHTA